MTQPEPRSNQYLPQTYPLWCAEVDPAAEDAQRAVTVSRVVGWRVAADTDPHGEIELVPVVARGKPITSIGPVLVGDEAFFLHEDRGDALRAGQAHWEKLDAEWRQKQAGKTDN
jgi:hypothetical protein